MFACVGVGYQVEGAAMNRLLRGETIAFLLDKEQAAFYLELLHEYNADRSSVDVGVKDDEKWLRSEMVFRDWITE